MLTCSRSLWKRESLKMFQVVKHSRIIQILQIVQMRLSLQYLLSSPKDLRKFARLVTFLSPIAVIQLDFASRFLVGYLVGIIMQVGNIM